MKFRSEDGELDVEAFEHAADVVFLAQEILVGYSSLSDAGDRAERARVPSARARLREPGRAADGARPAIRLGRRPSIRRRDHRADDRTRVSQVGGDRRPDGAVRGLPAERGGDARRDREAPRVGREHRRGAHRADRPADRGPQGVGRRARPRRGERLPERAGDGAGPHRLPRRRQPRLHEPRARPAAQPRQSRRLEVAGPRRRGRNRRRASAGDEVLRQRLRAGRLRRDRPRVPDPGNADAPDQGRHRRRQLDLAAVRRDPARRPGAADAQRHRRRSGSR